MPDPPWIKESRAETRGTFEHATEQALRRKVPPAATPLGLLLAAGCRWFKDWYFPEGGREDGTKLQGTLLLDDGRRRPAETELVAELRAFIERPRTRGDGRRRARDALALLDERRSDSVDPTGYSRS